MTPRGRRARANRAHKPGEECLFVEKHDFRFWPLCDRDGARARSDRVLGRADLVPMHRMCWRAK